MESKNVWIKWYKILVYISVGGILFFGLVLALEEAPAFFIAAVLVAALDLVLGMLIATFFENVQAIRDKLENM